MTALLPDLPALEDSLHRIERPTMTLNTEFSAAWIAGASMNEPLAQLVIETNSRAAGCWRLVDGHLILIGFGSAFDMPESVSQGFQTATQRVSLTQVGLGIVKAATTAMPAIALRDPETTGLDRSASWIVRFDCNSSLSMPIQDKATNAVIGVLAISTTAVIEENDNIWTTMMQLAHEIGRSA